MKKKIDSLTPREFQVLALMAQGYSDSEIASKLFISLTTIKTHVNVILDKLGISNTTTEVHVLRPRAILIFLEETGRLEKRNEQLEQLSLEVCEMFNRFQKILNEYKREQGNL